MAHPGDHKDRPSEEPPSYEGYEPVIARLTTEFARQHSAETVCQCVCAARHGAEDVTGGAPPDLVERIARKHLQVLAIVAAERRQKGGLRNAAT